MLEYLPVLLFVIVALGFGAVTIGLSSIIFPMRTNAIKNDPYECGVDPVGNARGRFSVKFYLVAVLFLLFDLEAVFLFPWATVYTSFVQNGAAVFILAEMAFFLGTLFLGWLYCLKRGAFQWD